MMVHKRRPADEDTTYVYTRAEDRSTWTHLSYLLDKYRLLVWLIWGVLIAFGFDFKTPAMASKETTAKLDSLRLRMDRQERYMESTQQGLNTLVRLRCLDVSVTSKTLVEAAGLTCGVGR